MKVKANITGEDETLFKMLAIQGGMSPDQLAQTMISDGLKFIKQSLEVAAKGSTLNEAMSEVLQRKQLDNEA